MSRRQEILDKVAAIPSMPSAVAKLMDLLKDPEVEITELTRVIEFEPGLTSNVLRLANSAYFAGPRAIGSLRDAIVRLGMNRIFQLVVTSAILPLTKQPVRGYDLSAGQLGEHAIAVAIGAEDLAKALGKKMPQNAFTAGLLHDLGKIALGTFIEVDANPILDLALQHDMSFQEAEAQILGIDHAEAGAVLLDSWNLPEDIVQAVRWHHDPDKVEGDPLVADLVHIADNLALSSGLGAGIDGLHYRLSEDVFARLGMKPHVAEAVICSMLGGIEDMRQFFGIGARRES